ncbi:MAG: 2-isopropylmalate synthase [Clostridia bacterium]
MVRQIKVFDTTLRDGEQSPGCSMNISEKLRLAEQLDILGVDIIEAGFAIASPGDFASVKSIAEIIKNATVASLARSLKKDIDVAWEAVKVAKKPRIHVFLATSDIHMEYKLKMTKEQVLARTKEMVEYAHSLCEDIEFSAEDASRSNVDFLCEVVETAINAGASTINIPDTVGYAIPEEYADLIRTIIKRVPNSDKAVISVHCHNDLGLATSNTLSAIKAGAGQVECTINGIGERAGNAALEEIVMGLYTRKNYYDAECNVDTKQIQRTSNLLTSITGVKPQPNKAIIGENAFAHESGIHQHGMLANKNTYEIMTPESVGLTTNKMVLGKHSGKHALDDKLRVLGHTVTSEQLEKIFDEFKMLADRQKNVSDRDIEGLLQTNTISIPEKYILERFVINVGNTIRTTSAIQLIVNDENGKQKEIETVTSSKFGPIDASFKAINTLVSNEIYELVDFGIDALTGGTDAQGSVTVKLLSDGKVYNGHSISVDIVESAIKAYISAINNMIYDKYLVNNGK